MDFVLNNIGGNKVNLPVPQNNFSSTSSGTIRGNLDDLMLLYNNLKQSKDNLKSRKTVITTQDASPSPPSVLFCSSVLSCFINAAFPSKTLTERNELLESIRSDLIAPQQYKKRLNFKKKVEKSYTVTAAGDIDPIDEFVAAYLSHRAETGVVCVRVSKDCVDLFQSGGGNFRNSGSDVILMVNTESGRIEARCFATKEETHRYFSSSLFNQAILDLKSHKISSLRNILALVGGSAVSPDGESYSKKAMHDQIHALMMSAKN
jgi:hypothetical protein